jgi:hypothetical protein
MKKEKNSPIADPKKLYIAICYILYKLKIKYPQFGINGTKNM